MSRCHVGNHTWERIPCFALAYVLLVLPCAGFLPNFWSRVLTLSWSTHTHQYMTEKAILNVTLETMKAIDRNAEEQRLGRGFWQAVGEVVKSNAAMDFLSSTRSDPVYHFDSERVDSAIIMLLQFWAQTVLSVRAKEFQSARRTLGQLFHSLQDFYSHSNWVEMGQRTIYRHLLHPDEHAFPVANDDTPTCLECFSATCRDNLLPRLANEQPPLLTTGYFSSYPSKPEGKCSHGGILDSSRRKAAKGGINKDSTSPIFSPHHYLHVEAARLAADATLTALRDLRDTVGLESFLRLFSVTQPPALVFVMDTTGSMFEEITAARLRALSIIQRRADTSLQPGTFLLVPFHDPGVGPVYETGDPDQFMGYMENLMALGGGDEPEMCLSAIQLALTHSPPLSEVFVFTDASPKDAHLYSAVKALALEKQCKVTFLLTEEQPRHKRESRRRRVALSPDRFSLYYSLSSISGGLTVFTTKSDIYKVSAIVEDITSAHKVTLLHVESDNDSTTRFFRVDSAVKTVTLHLTGNLIDCSLINPSGQSQSLLSEEGPLAELVHFDGLYRIHLLSPIQTGLWSLQAKADGRLTFNIIGESSVDFLYYFATVSNKTHPGLARVEGSPIAGVATFLVLVVTGLADNEEVLFSHVTLLGANGESLQQVLLNTSSPSSTSSYTGEELVGRVCSVPPVPFCVRLSGQDGQGNKLERVSTEMIQPTQVQIQVLIVPNLVAGHTSAVHFKVLNHGPARVINLSAVDDYGYLHQRGSHSVPVAERGSVEDQVDLHTPATAETGRTVTLTVTVHAMDSSDSNYAVVYLTVVPQDPDLSPPSCTIEQVEHPCPPRQLRCSTSSWSVSLAVSDRRSGLSSLQLNQGDGALTLLHGPLYPGSPGDAQTNQQPSDEGGVTPGSIGALEKGDRPVYVSDWVGASSQLLWLRYTSSCCSSSAELLVWDKAGNMKRCHVTSGQQRAMKDMSAESETSGSVNTSPTNCFCMLLGLLWTCLP